MSEQVRITIQEETRKINPKIWRKLRKDVGEKEFFNVIHADYADQIKYLSNFFTIDKIFLPKRENSAAD